MPKLKMTDAAIQRVTAAPGERADYFDAHPRDRVAGLVLRVTGSRNPDGTPKVSRVWAVMCRVRGSTKVRRFTIGDYPETKLVDARRKAGEIASDAKWKGTDPLKVNKEAARAAEIAGKDTVEAVIASYLTDLEKQPKSNGDMRAAGYITETRRIFDNHVLPRWGNRNIREITRREVNDLLTAVRDDGSSVKDDQGKRRQLAGGGSASIHTLRALRTMFNFAIGSDIIQATPVAKVKRPWAEKPRERTLDDNESRAVWAAAEGMSYPWRPFFQLLLLLGQRRDEISNMRWADIDFEEKTWTLTPEDTKARRAHVVPLPPLAVEILQALPRKSYTGPRRRTLPSPFVFTTDGDVPISGYSKAKLTLDKAIERARGEPLASFTIHDLRRTAATKMAELGITEFIVARVLNHAAAGVTGRHYNKYHYLAEKRHALETWAAYLESLTAPPGGNVVELRPLAPAAVVL